MYITPVFAKPPSCKVSKIFANDTDTGRDFQIGRFWAFLLMLTDLNLFANAITTSFSTRSAPFANDSPIVTPFRPFIGKHVAIALAKHSPFANPNQGQTSPLANRPHGRTPLLMNEAAAEASMHSTLTRWMQISMKTPVPLANTHLEVFWLGHFANLTDLTLISIC